MSEQEGNKELKNSGRWVEPAVSYVDPARRFCGYCGRPIARRYWEREERGERRAYCGPGHAARTTYPMSDDER